jgi:hypothetical protein
MEIHLLYKIYRNFNRKFYLFILDIEIFHLLLDNLICMIFIRYEMKVILIYFNINNLEKIIGNSIFIFR